MQSPRYMYAMKTHIGGTRGKWVKVRKKWPLFLNFDKHYSKCDFLYLIEIPLKVVSKGPNDNKWILHWLVVWCWTGDKVEPMMTKISDDGRYLEATVKIYMAK